MLGVGIAMCCASCSTATPTSPPPPPATTSAAPTLPSTTPTPFLIPTPAPHEAARVTITGGKQIQQGSETDLGTSNWMVVGACHGDVGAKLSYVVTQDGAQTSGGTFECEPGTTIINGSMLTGPGKHRVDLSVTELEGVREAYLVVLPENEAFR